MRTVQTAPTRPVWEELVAELPVGVLLMDASGNVLAGNRLAADLLGLAPEDLLSGTCPPGWSTHDDSGAPLPTRAELADQVLRTGALTIPLVVTRHGRRQAQLWAEHHPLLVHGEQRLLVLLQPVTTDLPHSRGLLDALTGLPGRALLHDRLDQALARARTHGTVVTLVLVDVHRMAAINAEHGFQRGDELLTAVGGRLREGLREDYTVARYGGDEFAVVAEHSRGSGEAVAERVRELAGRAVRIGGGRVRPGMRVCWVTSDGAAPTHAVIAHVEERLRG
ncbi:GGDEF domain-containing protein [Umezawaea sp. Da 62-37]|uniref:GGDEF domain-containing protein n=1 Tax=Umezawaea sp. Da 62-37 TaxID=3075927 RepID=UPI0028F6C866|nr:GGDEF domain-containing protein [Umezawaea sp. Da 62-37]WNV91378.1 GGDEF domain-containing protein [Umezawaea sp. Da 62-37]